MFRARARMRARVQRGRNCKTKRNRKAERFRSIIMYRSAIIAKFRIGSKSIWGSPSIHIRLRGRMFTMCDFCQKRCPILQTYCSKECMRKGIRTCSVRKNTKFLFMYAPANKICFGRTDRCAKRSQNLLWKNCAHVTRIFVSNGKFCAIRTNARCL